MGSADQPSQGAGTADGTAAVVEHALEPPSLAFAVGLYLPVSLTTPILVGGRLRKAIESRYSGDAQKEKREAGVLFSSGLIAGADRAGDAGRA